MAPVLDEFTIQVENKTSRNEVGRSFWAATQQSKSFKRGTPRVGFKEWEQEKTKDAL